MITRLDINPAVVKIVRKAARINRFKKAANHQRNKQTRAALYAKHNGNIGWNRDVAEWHGTLKGLSNGSV